MCLGEIGRVSGVAERDSLTVEVGERTLNVSALTSETVPAVGAWVVVHSGFVLGELTAAEAHDALQLRRSAAEETP